MRFHNALLVAGIVIIVGALSGASFAADEAGRTEPADVVATEDVGDADALAPDAVEANEPVPGDGDDRPADEVAAQAVEPTLDGGRGDAGRDGSGDGGDRDRDRKGKEKVPLADASVDMVNISFKPKKVSIEPGDEVTWTNKDTAQHDAVGEGAANFDTGLLEKGETASVPFNETGTFKYICTVHPTMKGEVRVGSSGGGSGDSNATSSGGGTADTGSSTGTGGSTFGNTGTGSDFSSDGGSSSGGGSLPQTGQAELPLLLLGTGLVVLGLLGRAFHEYWIWR
jgi:plastocyanin